MLQKIWQANRNSRTKRNKLSFGKLDECGTRFAISRGRTEPVRPRTYRPIGLPQPQKCSTMTHPTPVDSTDCRAKSLLHAKSYDQIEGKLTLRFRKLPLGMKNISKPAEVFGRAQELPAPDGLSRFSRSNIDGRLMGGVSHMRFQAVTGSDQVSQLDESP